VACRWKRSLPGAKPPETGEAHPCFRSTSALIATAVLLWVLAHPLAVENLVFAAAAAAAAAAIASLIWQAQVTVIVVSLIWEAEVAVTVAP